jgi:sugar-specific transcriptional regulator TrmB
LTRWLTRPTALLNVRAVTDAIAVDRLVRIGLTRYEARVYVALIRRDGWTAADMARTTGVPRPRVYDVLASLVAKGLAAERPGSAAKYVAVDPERAMRRLVEAHEQRMELVRDEARATARELAHEFAEGNKHQDPLDYVEVIRDRQTLAQRFDELQAAVTSEMLAFSKEPAVVDVERNVVGMKTASEHLVRSIYEISLLRDPVRRAGVRRFVDLGEHARFVERLPMKLAIIDERIVMFALSNPVAGPDDMTSVVIEHADLAAVLKVAFEVVWSKGLMLDDACARLGI